MDIRRQPNSNEMATQSWRKTARGIYNDRHRSATIKAAPTNVHLAFAPEATGTRPSRHCPKTLAQEINQRSRPTPSPAQACIRLECSQSTSRCRISTQVRSTRIGWTEDNSKPRLVQANPASALRLPCRLFPLCPASGLGWRLGLGDTRRRPGCVGRHGGIPGSDSGAPTRSRRRRWRRLRR